jgi:uncharacterized protein (DUF1697 family)
MEPIEQKYVALLRGINVGGKHIVPMKHLAEIFDAAKCVDVKTYIQSGNVIFTAPPKLASKLPAVLARAIEARFGFPVRVVLRSRDELAQVAAGNPFLKAGLPEKTLHVYFLADAPTISGIESLDPNRSTSDRFHVCGREVYLHTPNGIGNTKLTSAYFDSKLSTIATARNWATVLKLLEMMRAA